MEPLNRARLGVLAVIVGAVAWGVSLTAVNSGASPMAVPWTVAAIAVGVGLVALWLGWGVRQYRRGKNPGLSGLRAARTAVFAQACAYTGTILAGAFAGYGLAIALEWSHAPRREVAISALIAALGGLAMVVAALIAEHWCKDDSSSEEGKQAPQTTP
ncbi:DUF3180 domain-containing protein [Demequina phytophila]|uniref:DUF3180 domain-containing protein n=1 Tax=Demequina phytophila TaxID=1638981 RepID=UPI000783B6C8|nr:DUF3180 domain-containing protein [Demequina phytophila]